MCQDVWAFLIGPAILITVQRRYLIGQYLGRIGFLSNQQTAGGFGIKI